MRYLMPYKSGMWLAEYLNRGCQLCAMYRSMPPSQLALANSPHALMNQSSAQLSEPSSWFAHVRHRLDSRFNQGLLCPQCHHNIHWLPAPFEVDIAAGKALTVQAATYYEYPIRQAIRAFKQEDMTKLPLLVHVLRQLPKPAGCHAHNSAIVAMPTTDSRLIKRGFDPVTILSAYLSQHWQIPLWHGVARIDSAASQQGLSRAERLSNLDGAFELRQVPAVERLLLFDDVATTGASLQALARTLHPQMLHSNAYYLQAFALAHGSA